MVEPVLSVCIASYNKAQTTTNLVKTILSNKNEKLAVVVVDNASTDNTIECLKEIEDSRLKILCNEFNIGGAANMVRAIYSGAGYCIYCNDRDLIYPNKLDDFIDFLEKHPEYSCGWVSRYSLDCPTFYTEYELTQAFKTMCWRCEHPTGFFFNKNFLNKIEESYWDEYINPNGWTAFPHENIQAELVATGKFVRYNIPVWKSTGNETHKKYVGGFDSLKTDGVRWFFPQNCINRSKAYLMQFWKLCDKYNIQIEENVRYDIYSNIILSAHKIGIWRYKVIFSSKSLSYHYAVKPKHVPSKELKKNSEVITNELLKVIRDKENKTSTFEKVTLRTINIYNKKMKRKLFLSKYLNKLMKIKMVQHLKEKVKSSLR